MRELFCPALRFDSMGEILTKTGIAIALGATLVLFVFGIRQWYIRQSVKDIPMRYKEWLAKYRVQRFYILLVQLLGIIIGIVGLSI